MNQKQKYAIAMCAVAILLMTLYPPFHLIHPNGMERNMGYSFLFSPPRLSSIYASVNISLLLTQSFVVAVGGVAAFLVFQKGGAVAEAPSAIKNAPEKSIFKNVVFACLRVVRGFVGLVFALQITGLMPAFTWLSNPSAITNEMIGIFLLKIAALAVFGLLFWALRLYINWLHKSWYGTPHPSLSKWLAL